MGAVRMMEWSSDGYVLAVGWENGWAVWSVGGRCLAWSFGVEYEVDQERFQDTFMYGVRDLVCSMFLATAFTSTHTFSCVVLGTREF